MKNPLQSLKFNCHPATKDRSPGFRAIVILLVITFTFVMIYCLNNKEKPTITERDSAASSLQMTK
jgi:hypothetical protein